MVRSGGGWVQVHFLGAMQSARPKGTPDELRLELLTMSLLNLYMARSISFRCLLIESCSPLE